MNLCSFVCSSLVCIVRCKLGHVKYTHCYCVVVVAETSNDCTATFCVSVHVHCTQQHPAFNDKTCWPSRWSLKKGGLV